MADELRKAGNFGDARARRLWSAVRDCQSIDLPHFIVLRVRFQAEPLRQ